MRLARQKKKNVTVVRVSSQDLFSFVCTVYMDNSERGKKNEKRREILIDQFFNCYSLFLAKLPAVAGANHGGDRIFVKKICRNKKIMICG